MDDNILNYSSLWHDAEFIEFSLTVEEKTGYNVTLTTLVHYDEANLLKEHLNLDNLNVKIRFEGVTNLKVDLTDSDHELIDHWKIERQETKSPSFKTSIDLMSGGKIQFSFWKLYFV